MSLMKHSWLVLAHEHHWFPGSFLWTIPLPVYQQVTFPLILLESKMWWSKNSSCPWTCMEGVGVGVQVGKGFCLWGFSNKIWKTRCIFIVLGILNLQVTGLICAVTGYQLPVIKLGGWPCGPQISSGYLPAISHREDWRFLMTSVHKFIVDLFGGFQLLFNSLWTWWLVCERAGVGSEVGDENRGGNHNLRKKDTE